MYDRSVLSNLRPPHLYHHAGYLSLSPLVSCRPSSPIAERAPRDPETPRERPPIASQRDAKGTQGPLRALHPPIDHTTPQPTNRGHSNPPSTTLCHSTLHPRPPPLAPFAPSTPAHHPAHPPPHPHPHFHCSPPQLPHQPSSTQPTTLPPTSPATPSSLKCSRTHPHPTTHSNFPYHTPPPTSLPPTDRIPAPPHRTPHPYPTHPATIHSPPTPPPRNRVGPGALGLYPFRLLQGCARRDNPQPNLPDCPWGTIVLFRRLDKDHSWTLSKDELSKGVAQFGLDFSEGDVTKLFAAFEKDGQSGINYEEFLDALRPSMTAPRKEAVEAVFKHLDKTGDGVVTLADLKGVYSAKNHPKVLKKEATEEELLTKFLNMFESNTSVDGKVTKKEFTDYYSGLSKAIDDDDYFVSVVKMSWGL
ncbi:Crustacean calcium-binding protein 23 [Penaeus vannamei]|uniref:Crustacean calcium-binding protein 23 n=1 Tax=Penaeus vannamei TaxID=6689 RepID=A0A3R7QTG8_PENVA|nr:Crustacean calcium-binding protein 23 [Penaeus vannamei]